MTEEEEKKRIQIDLLRRRREDLMNRPLDPRYTEASMRAFSEEITEIDWEIKYLEGL
jgi:hypothetical protein